MAFNRNDIAQQVEKAAVAGMLAAGRPQTLKENLTQQLVSAQANVARLDELLRLLEQNPEVDRILELMQKGY